MRQAVVVIHGVGEQRPMNTLRAFVKGVAGGKKYYNRPDTASSSFELRILRLTGERNTRPTDFYEFYWAHHMRNTAAYMVLTWLKVIFSKKKEFRLQIRLILVLAELVISILASLLILYFLKKDLIPAFIAAKLSIPSLLLSLAALSIVFCRQIYETVGKAARYLNPTPFNVKERNAIRKEGFQLLDNLHKSDKYDRIIIIGHSLGSVIGYDLIRDYWSKTVYPSNCDLNQTSHRANKKFRNAVKSLLQSEISSCQFHKFQHDLWQEYNDMGIKWLITDFITVGSPLTHAAALLSDDEASFSDKILEKEFVISPPLNSEKKATWYNIDLKSDEKRSVRFPPSDHAFSAVRWNNIYFKHRFLLWGDPIGGKLEDVFGEAINDREISPGLLDLFSCHIRYWKSARKTTAESVLHLTESMKLGVDKSQTKLIICRDEESTTVQDDNASVSGIDTLVEGSADAPVCQPDRMSQIAKI